MGRVTIAQHESEAGSWRIARLEPEGVLASSIGAFYAYDERETSFRRRRELPDGSAVLIFHLGGKLLVEHPTDTRQEFREGQGFFSGASATYAVTETDGAQAGAQIKFSLLGARLFMGCPLEEFGDALIDASQAFGRPATELRDRLAETRSLSQKVGDARAGRKAEARFPARNFVRTRPRGPAPSPRRRSDRGRRPRDRNEPRALFEGFPPGVRPVAESLRARPALRSHAPCPATRAVLIRRSARRSLRIRRPGPHDSRLPGIFRRRALGAVAAGTARRWRVRRLSETSHFYKTAGERGAY